MKHYIEKEETRKSKVLEKTTCDWCANEVLELTDLYRIEEFILQHKTGTAYPEGGSGKIIEIDLCSSCIPKFFKLLCENGINVIKKDWDY